MSDFRALKGFMDKVCEAGEPFGETRKNYFFQCIHLPNFKRLSMEVAESYHAAEEELVFNLDKLGDDNKKTRYLREAKAILFESLDLANFLQHNSRLMLQALTDSEEVGQGSIEERAFLQMAFTVNLHWKDDLGQDPAFPTLPFDSRERIALYQIVGTGAYEAWEALNKEVDRQLRLVDAPALTSNTAKAADGTVEANHKRKSPLPTPSEIKLAAGAFNLNSFISRVSLKPSTLSVIDRALMIMGAIKKVSDGTFESIEENGIGVPFMAVYRKLVDLNK